MGFFDFITDNVVIAGSKKHTEHLAPKVAIVLKNHGVSCHCGGLAVPNIGEGKIYKCLECDKQFANAYYNVYQKTTSYSSAIHNRAIQLLKSNADLNNDKTVLTLFK